MPMTLVRIAPKVAQFTELHTFRCFACGDVRAIEQGKTQMIQAAAWPRPSLFHQDHDKARPQPQLTLET
jgi:hypothetical protein